MPDNKKHTIKRSEEITSTYFAFLDNHLSDIVAGDVTRMLELNEIADEMNISHTHLTDTVQQTTGNHPCYFYDHKILNIAKVLLKDQTLSIAEIARILTYDPSNFSKFFKKFVSMTPGEFRKTLQEV
ncbi:AraC family transcriptional regulator [Dyadobacter sp. CY312]|uniref:helix-turn-helix domain-containing protein n=1 Tax=Dyadobacter sp. CY312 TaxID=2907303 RepID=UPI001F439C51|nr:AraC family transcriptional regulator [Dyadobacter sp. CY312]MCE7040161.1 AraC family transcriptional regulator [Dyadobacter sp. CY312]